MKVMVLGDTHGNTKVAVHAARLAKRAGVKKIVQVGDFGLWSHVEGGVTFLDSLNEELRKHGIRLHAVGGNHENWDHWNWHVENTPKDRYGFAMIRTHIRLAPRVHFWNWEGKTMAAAGGAVSIDRDYRLAIEKAPRTLWWPNEQLTEDDVNSIRERKVDYLFTHDCSNRTPFKYRLKPDIDSQIHRQRIDKVLSKVMPEMHFHGHMHEKYDWQNLVNGHHWTQTYGLECDGMAFNWGVLDLDDDKFEFAHHNLLDK